MQEYIICSYVMRSCIIYVPGSISGHNICSCHYYCNSLRWSVMIDQLKLDFLSVQILVHGGEYTYLGLNDLRRICIFH